MRDWAITARPASFRGARFHVDRDSPQRGRRIVVHEISGGDSAVTEDMGRSQTRFTVDAYVASDRADAEGRALEAACDATGPALLALPFDLPVMAHCERCSRDRSKDRNGWFGYTLDFVAAGGAATASMLPIGAIRAVFASGSAAAAAAISGAF